MQREALRSWLEEGLSLKQIARVVGKHPSTVGYWAKKHGLTSTHAARHAARGEIPCETLEALVARHLTVREIAAEVNRSTATVRHWLSRYGLRTRRAHGVPAGVAVTATTAEGDCPKHGAALYIRRRDGAWRCLHCRAEAVKDRRRRVKETIVHEAGRACALCGYDRCVAALHFHHRDPASKRFGLASRGITLALEAVRDEARKCVLLCANCHAEVEAGIATLPSTS